MKDTAKTKKQLIVELEELRQQRVVEQAAERVREAVLAMRSSEDLLQVVGLLYQEVRGQGLETECVPSFFSMKRTIAGWTTSP